MNTSNYVEGYYPRNIRAEMYIILIINKPIKMKTKEDGLSKPLGNLLKWPQDIFNSIDFT